ncbi:MAG: porin [Acidobacteriota bacterium]
MTGKKNGWTFDFGKFYTSVGAELTENNYTWHYGRGYLYTNGPYYHMGLRVTKALGEQWVLGFQVVNGWNNVEDNNSGKTLGFTTAYTAKSKKWSWLTNSYVGPEKTGTNKGWKNIYDTVINFSPTDKWTGYIDYYHGWGKPLRGGQQRQLARSELGCDRRLLEVHHQRPDLPCGAL